MSEKYTTTIRITRSVREKLRRQADKLGLDMSSYIAYLVMYKEEKDLQEQKARALAEEFIKAKVF